MNKHISWPAAALVLVATAILPAYANHGTNSVDRQFVMSAAESGTQEVREAKAAQRGTDANARTFAAKMIHDHTKANAQLALLAQEVGLSNAVRRGVSMAPAQTAAIGGREYLASQVSAHQTAVALFEREAAQGESASLRAFARMTLPKLRAHLELAQRLTGQP